MSEDDPLSGLRPVLLTWFGEAASVLTVASWAQVGGTLTWARGQDDQYVPAVKPMSFMAPETRQQLAALPSFKELETAVQASPVLAPMLGCLVGTPRSRSLFGVWSVADAFLPSLEDLVRGETISFDDRYNAISNLLRLREVEIQTTCPLRGITFGEVPVNLAPGLSIDKLTLDETILALDVGLLQPVFGWGSPFRIDAGQSFALKKRMRLPLVVNSQGQERPGDDGSLAMVLASQARDEMLQLQQCIALMTHEPVSISGSVSHISSPTYIISDTGVQSSLISPGPWFGTSINFDQSSCEGLRALWDIANSRSFSRNRAIALAVRRLTIGTQRKDVEDRLLDVFIAAEALYLSDADDARERGELRYRLALRAAVWSEGTLDGWTRRDVFKLMKTGYDARSAVAHGGQPRPKDVIVKSTQVTLPDLVRATEDVVRAGLYKAVQKMAGTDKGLTIPWDDLVLPDHGMSDQGA